MRASPSINHRHAGGSVKPKLYILFVGASRSRARDSFCRTARGSLSSVRFTPDCLPEKRSHMYDDKGCERSLKHSISPIYRWYFVPLTLVSYHGAIVTIPVHRCNCVARPPAQPGRLSVPQILSYSTEGIVARGGFRLHLDF